MLTMTYKSKHIIFSQILHKIHKTQILLYYYKHTAFSGGCYGRLSHEENNITRE